MQQLATCTPAFTEPSQVLEARIISALQRAPSATHSAIGSDFFLVPARPACLAASGMAPDALSALYTSALETLPHFQISGGRDHIFVFTTQAGPWVFPKWYAIP